MTQFQMLMIGLGAIMAVSAFWDQIIALIPKPTQTVRTDNPPKRTDSLPETTVKKDPCECNDLCITDLTEIVRLWENLRSQCEDYNLQEAVTELDKIFPLLVKVQKTKPAPPKPEGTA